MSDSVSNLIQTVAEYIEVKTERMRLKLVSKSAAISSLVLTVILFVLLSFFIFLFLSFGLAYFLNGIYQSYYLGFLILASFYFVILLILAILFKRKVIQSLFESIFIKLIDPEEDESED